MESNKYFLYYLLDKGFMTNYIGRHVVEKPDHNDKIINYYNSHMNRDFIPSIKNENIPLNCFMCWNDKNMPPFMKQNVINLITYNSAIRFHIYHEPQCRSFIEKHFSERVLFAYDTLIPYSYKRDLWKYCALYIRGGIYLDIKYNCVNGFQLQTLCSDEYVVLDRPGNWEPGTHGMHTGLIVVKPQNEIMKKCIDTIVENVTQKIYGWDNSYPTGAGMLGKIYFDSTCSNNMQISLFLHKQHNHIYLQKVPILREYPEYKNETRSRFEKFGRKNLWNANLIYRHKYTKIQQGFVQQSGAKKLLCVFHIGNYDTFVKMKKYIDTLLESDGKEYNLDFQVNIVEDLHSADIKHICDYLPHATLYTSFNYGFDIASFFYIMDQLKLSQSNYDYVLKIHTKSCDTTRNNILDPLLENVHSIRRSISMFENDLVGMVTSKYSYCSHLIERADINVHYISQLLKTYFGSESYYSLPFVAGTMFFIRFSILRDAFFQFDMPSIYNSFNHKHTFDYHWYYVNHYLQVKRILLSRELLYDHYCREGMFNGFSRNLLHAVENPDNTSKLLRDGMLEHAYERFFAYIVDRLKCTVKVVDYD